MDIASPTVIEIQDPNGSQFAFRFDDQTLLFQEAKLSFIAGIKSNVFGQKNNKTVAETLAHRRYAKLLSLIFAEYPNAMNEPLGIFLLGLKNSGTDTYKRFLNAYGDSSYCTFRMGRGSLSRRKGLYCYRLKGEIVYVGRSYDPFEKRINQGYGTIHPKNCYVDGQATNCHLNALIASNIGHVTLFVCPLDNDSDIERLERRVIQLLQPRWNIALRYE